MNMKQDLRFVLTGLFVAALSCLGIARADLIVTPVGLSASKTIFEPGESNDVFFIQNTSAVAVQITAESVACPNTGGDKTDNITCSILTTAKLRNIPGKDPDGTVHGIFASVDFGNTDAPDFGPLADGQNTIEYSVVGSDGSKGTGSADVSVSDVPEPQTTGVLIAIGCFLLGRRLILSPSNH
jgi:hypothetical protein